MSAEWRLASTGSSIEPVEVCLGPGRCLVDNGVCHYCVTMPDGLTLDQVPAFAARVMKGH